MGKVGIVIIVVLVLAGLVGCGQYNKLVNLDESIDSSWAQVETVLQRRYDLIPNLVATVQGYAKHESGVFEEVTRLRSQWASAQTPEAKIQAANQLESTLSKLMVISENYPELKANQNFIALQDELSGTENRIAVERRRYNETVRDYNMAVRRFPAALFAGLLGFQKRDVYFEAAEGAQKAPQVKF